MNWRNVKLVWMREIRDQLRDRRTLFMVAVLPLLMYPLMGASYLQLAQFRKTHKATVVMVGAQQLDEIEGLPPLLEAEAIAPGLFSDPKQASLLKLRRVDDSEGTGLGTLTRELREGLVDAVVVFPSNFGKQLQKLQEQTRQLAERKVKDVGGIAPVPKPVIQFNAAREKSLVAQSRLRRAFDNWRELVMRHNLAEGDVPEALLMPFTIETQDIASDVQRRAGLWATLLPFVVFVWALTGAFYPAVDLCAGEKERGTLETLLACPAQRSEIVWGKLLTVICFSVATSLLNLLSLGATGHFFLSSIGSSVGQSVNLGLPPLSSLAWVLFALPPIAALFSALSIACASFAKSTKEGQYYFMPLFMGAMPLMLMPLSPGIELNLGNSVVPVMGVVLLLRSLIEGHYAEAFQYFLPVTIVTLGCCLLSVKWAVHQFNQESVLFREGERFSVGQWLKKLVREPKELPTAGMAMACVAMVFMLKFFAELAVVRLQPMLSGQSFLAANVLISQACILLPALLMALLLVKKSGVALFGRGNSFHGIALGILVAFLLALVAHPVTMALQGQLQQIFPPSEEMLQAMKGLESMMAGVSPWLLVLFVGVLPGFCEEITFRGFILGGLRSTAPSLWSVLITAVAFGAIHGILLQSVNAAILGVLLGYLAIRFNSIWPAITFHITNNSLLALFSHHLEAISEWAQKTGWRRLLVLDDGRVGGYHGAVVTLAAVALCLLLLFAERTRPRATTITDPAP